jgi:hypothetical protein
VIRQSAKEQSEQEAIQQKQIRQNMENVLSRDLDQHLPVDQILDDLQNELPQDDGIDPTDQYGGA